MARTALTVSQIARAGVQKPSTGTAADTANGNSFVNDGRTILFAKNTNGASTSRTVTVTPTATVDGLSATGRTKTMAAGEEWIFGPFPLGIYSGVVAVDGSHAEVTFQVFRLTEG